jgi:hypothetical protein
MKHPDELKPANRPAAKQALQPPEKTLAPSMTLSHRLPFRRGAVSAPESGNHSEAWILEKESLCLCRVGKSIL